MPELLLLLVLVGRAGGSAPDHLARTAVVAAAPALDCPGRHPLLLGIASRPLSLAEMVTELERGCLALGNVRFRLGQDTIESLSPAEFAQVARAIGLAQGVFRVAVPAERSSGSQPDTLQARRRGARLRDELVHYGASPVRLLEDPGWPTTPAVAGPGGAVPMLIRVPDS
jgi:hypothetical protein